MGNIPTTWVKLKKGKATCLINTSDFNEKLHTKCVLGSDGKPVKEDAAKAEAKPKTDDKK